MIRFGSVCSGIEAASVAWHPLGWQAAWLAEIEPFPSAVLKHHYPAVPNYGDMTQLPDRILCGEVEAPDLFCGGTPCQAFSVAGLRKSLDDARGNLSLVFCEIANAIDHVRVSRGEQPAVVFWENVPGVLSTKDNAFGCFLAGLAGEDDPLVPPGGKWTNAGCVHGPQRTVAWRILDAQYFGVAQRRRRVFVVASARADFDPAAVLFEFDGVRRDTAPSREAGKTVAGGASDCAGTLYAQYGRKLGCNDFDTHGGALYPIAFNARQDPDHWHDRTGPLDTDGCTQAVMQPYTLAIRGRGDSHNLEYRQDGTANALLTPNGGRGGIGVGAVASFKYTMGSKAHGIGYAEEQSPTLDTRPESNAVLVPAQPVAFQDKADCLTSAYGTKWNGNASATNGSLFAQQAMQVRRLTPVECERLQGFPDNYTAIPWRKKPVSECPDGPRYKALGNSWAVPVVRWIGQRIHNAIAAVTKIEEAA
jgi:DNA (cytosine-5)-methyltransferase 1